MTVREYRDVSARLLALLATAPKKNKKGPGMIAKLKRVQNALWEAIQRPVADELTRIATDGSHTLGSSDPAGWGAAVWFGESEEIYDSLFGPVISDFKVLDPNLTNKFYLGALQHSNNTGEVSAACEALLHVLIKGEPQGVLWWYDSELTCSVAKGISFIAGETELCNTLRKLFAKVSYLAKDFGGIRCEHVYSHLGHTQNEIADALADRGTHETCKIGRYAPDYIVSGLLSDCLIDRLNPPQPDLDLAEVWGTLARCVRETQEAVLEKKTGRQRKKVKPSVKTLRLEKDLRSGSVAMSKEDKTSLGAALRASKKKDRDNRTKQIITVMTREYVAGNVKGVSECMNELSNSSKFCSVQPMHHITHDSQGKVKVLGGFKTSKEATDLWTEKMEVRFAKREGDDEREGDTLEQERGCTRFRSLDRETFDLARRLTKPFKAGGKDEIQGAIWVYSDVAGTLYFW